MKAAPDQDAQACCTKSRSCTDHADYTKFLNELKQYPVSPAVAQCNPE
jgi:hypothetical protein